MAGGSSSPFRSPISSGIRRNPRDPPGKCPSSGFRGARACVGPVRDLALREDYGEIRSRSVGYSGSRPVSVIVNCDVTRPLQRVSTGMSAMLMTHCDSLKDSIGEWIIQFSSEKRRPAVTVSFHLAYTRKVLLVLRGEE